MGKFPKFGGSLLTGILCCAAQSSYGAPTVTSISGSITQGEVVSISGTGFSTRGNHSPFYWDDYESKTLGQSAIEAGLDDLGYDLQGLPKVQNDVKINTKSLRMDYLINKDSMFPRIGKSGLNSQEVYVSVWTYMKRTAGAGERLPILKLVRGGTNPPYSGVPRFYETVRPDKSGTVVGSDRGSVASNGSTTWTQDVNMGQNYDGWHRSEYYFKLSTPGVADGIFQTWVDGIQNVNLLNTMSRLAGSSALINYVMSPFDGNDSYGLTNSYSLWMDNFYIDTTRARVELGNAETLAGSKVRDIQPTTQWSSSAISFKMNLSTFAPTDKIYLYVFDSNGNVNSTGYPVRVSSQAKPLPPISPNITIN